MTAYLELQDVIFIHETMIERYGGAALPGRADCVDAALAMPMQEFSGQQCYETIAEKAAAYLFHFAKKHCFPDGNKRVAAGSAVLYLRLNGHYLDSRRTRANQLANLTLDVVTGACSLKQAARWFERRLVPLPA